jgi:uncharacterized protein YggE
MPRRINCLMVVTFVAAVSSAQVARAQSGPESGVVSGNGVVVISRKPETMRLLVVLQGKGATLKDALASIKSRGEAAKKQLATLGAGKDSIKLDDAKIAEPDNNQQQQRRMQMMQRGGGKAPKAGKKAAKTPDPILVSATLTAEWKLEGKSADDLLMTVHGLQEKIKGADLAGSKEAEKLTPEQEEALEEMQAEDGFGSFNQNEGPKPGEPMFLFVTHIPDADREKAFSQAYQKARTDASRIAKAAGMELGELKSLHGPSGNYNRGYNYNSRSYRVLQMANAATGTPDDEVSEDSTEVVGGDSGHVKFNVTVSASFDLKRPK